MNADKPEGATAQMPQDNQRFLAAARLIAEGRLDIMALIATAHAMQSEGRPDYAVLLYKYWLQANPSHHLRYAAAYNCGSDLLARGDGAGAIEMLRRAVDAKPDFFPAHINLGSALERYDSPGAAVTEWQAVVDMLAAVSHANMGFKVQALKNIARVRGATSTDATAAALRQAIEIDPTQRELVHHWINARQVGCVWPVLEPVGALSVRDLEQLMAPLSMSLYVDDPWMIKASARNESTRFANTAAEYRVWGGWPKPRKLERSKLKIAYLSSDFCNHAVGYLAQDIFQYHDRDRFDVSVFNIGKKTNDTLQQKIAAKVDHWIDIGGMTDKQGAAAIIASDIDILFDMNGHTSTQRTRILALKPAPVVINWLGYPGTMGSDFHHYIIGDDFIIPEGDEAFYSEKVLRLPCYQPNGHLYPVPSSSVSRAEFGLPENAVVFCCFNGSTKITEAMFSLWMRILARVEGSVLWMRGNGADADNRLRSEAEKRGIDPNRLVVLAFRSNTEYLAAHRFADVFLDTFPYGAHTTASDALRMGVPIVTLAGKGFASRVCGSLCRSAGVPQTVCRSVAQYEALAIELATNTEQRAKLKQQLANSLPDCVLFNPKLLVEHLESRLRTVWRDHCSGLPLRPDFSDADDN